MVLCWNRLGINFLVSGDVTMIRVARPRHEPTSGSHLIIVLDRSRISSDTLSRIGRLIVAAGAGRLIAYG